MTCRRHSGRRGQGSLPLLLPEACGTPSGPDVMPSALFVGCSYIATDVLHGHAFCNPFDTSGGIRVLFPVLVVIVTIFIIVVALVLFAVLVLALVLVLVFLLLSVLVPLSVSFFVFAGMVVLLFVVAVVLVVVFALALVLAFD